MTYSLIKNEFKKRHLNKRPKPILNSFKITSLYLLDK